MTLHLGTLADLPAQAHTVIMLGRRTSELIRELIRIAEFKGKIAYRIERAAELQPRWFTGEEHVGVVLCTDELQEEMSVVLERLENFSATQQQGQLEGVAL